MLEIKLDNDELLKENYGKTITLNQFLSDCKNTPPKRSDGFIYEILLDERIICKEILFADELSKGSVIRQQLDAIQEKYGSLSIVWYKNP